MDSDELADLLNDIEGVADVTLQNDDNGIVTYAVDYDDAFPTGRVQQAAIRTVRTELSDAAKKFAIRHPDREGPTPPGIRFHVADEETLREHIWYTVDS